MHRNGQQQYKNDGVIVHKTNTPPHGDYTPASRDSHGEWIISSSSRGLTSLLLLPSIIPLTFMTNTWNCALLLSVLLFGVTSHVTSYPIANGSPSQYDQASQSKYSAQFDSTVYLSKFGYLPKSDMETGALRNKSELTNAIKKFQRMAHIAVTGRLDTPTTDKMLAPRCGVTDDLQSRFESTSRGKRYVLGPSKWPNKDLTYRIQNYTPDLQTHETRAALLKAFQVWSDITELTFEEIFHGEADIMIKFAHMYHHDGYPFDGAGMTLAHAFFPGPGQDGDVHFDEDETWTVASHEGVNFFMVAAHEIGHALGLGHSSVLGALMYPWYQGYTPNFQLSSDDLVAIQYLYGSREKPPTPRPPVVRPTTRPTRPTRPPYVPEVPPVFTTRRPQISTTQSPDQPPDTCTTNIDAAAIIRQEAYFFKGTWFWRTDAEGIVAGFPVKLDRFFFDFPDTVTHIDAVYERKTQDGKIVFFSGDRFWVFNGNKMDAACPVAGCPLSDMGFPADIKQVDAAFVWGYNEKTYLIVGDMYWRYNEDLRTMDVDYPRDMSMWDGVPRPVDAAFQFWDGNTYFFNGQHFWKFKDSLMRVDTGYPQRLGPFWLDCTKDVLATPEVNNSPSPGCNLAFIFLLYLLSYCLKL